MSQAYGNVPAPNDAHFDRGYGNGHSGVNDFATGNPSANMSSPLGQSMGQQGFGGQFHEDFDAGSRPTSSVADGPHHAGINRSASNASTAVYGQANQGTPSRSNTLKKKASIRRSGSRKSLAAGSIRSVGGKSVGGGNETEDFNSAFHTPIPTQGSPTDILANRFQSWRQLLKSLIAYFREVQTSYDARAKAVGKVQNALGGIAHPSVFVSDNGLADATRILEDFHRHSAAEANKSREIENDVIAGLTGLRSDLNQKIKEIKSLSGDFKNSVDKEKEATRREVEKLQDALQHADHEDSTATGKNDPYVVKLGVDRMVEKQIDEENYLHRAYLNLEASGRELESIVVGEIQKAYNALAGILKREGDDAYKAVEGLRSGPISMPKDQEWSAFVHSDPHFVAPDVPLRRIEEIDYPGRNHPAASEIRAGMLERKSKYLKSYSPGWYVLSPTHLHEFKSADKIYTQPPVMSLCLADQKLGTHSEPDSSSAKFMLKGRQTGGMHKGHSWVFRAESHETMLAWYQDIKALTEKTGEERSAFVRSHARSVSGNSERPRSFSSDGLEEDEADRVPYSADAASLSEQNPVEAKPQRPQPGGRFPSDLNLSSGNAALQSPSSESSDHNTIQATGAYFGTQGTDHGRSDEDPYRLRGIASHSPEKVTTPATAAAATAAPKAASYDDDQERYMASQPQAYQSQVPPQEPVQNQAFYLPGQQPATTYQQAQPVQAPAQQSFEPAQARGLDSADSSALPRDPDPRHSSYGNWMAPAALGAGAGVAGTAAYNHMNNKEDDIQQQQQQPLQPETGVAGSRGLEDPLPAAPAPTTTSSTNNIIPIPAYNNADMPNEQITNTASAGPTTLNYGPAPTTDKGTTLGGQEAAGAHETGHIFPSVVRHDTDISVSQLHVPGSFPKRN